jgi:hypothetical protein
MTYLLRSLIRESLLLEEVYGAQATVYHGTRADPQVLISALLDDTFRPGEGSGSMYGKGLYTVYNLKGAKTNSGEYGDYVIKLKVNLYGYIIFDAGIAKKVYKAPLSIVEQAKEFGYSDGVIKALRSEKSHEEVEFTSYIALSVFRSLQYEVKGLVFTGSNDGPVVVVYDPTTAVPMAWKRVAVTTYAARKPVYEPWKPVDRAALLKPLERPDLSDREDRSVQQSALRRSAMGSFEAGKWDPLARLNRLPEDQRVVKGDLNLSRAPITSLPTGLKVNGNLYLNRSSITSLPSGLNVSGNIHLYAAPITSLPERLKVGGDLDIGQTSITSLPANLQVGGDLDIKKTSITSLPADLKVGGNLYLYSTSVTSLPPDLKVGSYIFGLDRKYWDDVPARLKGKLK